ncbi:MAG TPA: hypothetical protein VGM56_17625 [Byssovorax sp.]|jgi:hypothetical protein
MWTRAALHLAALVTAGQLCACRGSVEARFALRPPLVVDADQRGVRVACKLAPTPKDPRHVSCAPTPYESPLYWDGADNLVFRPLSDALAVKTSAESVDVNSLDEVPDSSWFTNRLGGRPLRGGELRAAGCSPSQRLDVDAAADASWVVDQGKLEGNSGAFACACPGAASSWSRWRSRTSGTSAGPPRP